MKIATAVLFLSACGSPQTPKPAAASGELSPALAPLAWWIGDWRGTDGSEHWVAAAGALYGVSLHGTSFEAMIVDDAAGPGPADGVLRFIAMPNGARSVEFKQVAVRATSAEFSNPEHDDPKSITYQRTGDELLAILHGPNDPQTFSFRVTKTERAPELEAADVAFAKDTLARGVEGWVAAFDSQGAMMRRGERVEGADAIKALMQPLLDSGKLEWAPIASARSGELGFTVGKATFTGAELWKSSYVTIWRKQADGTWKVLFDVGRVVNE